MLADVTNAPASAGTTKEPKIYPPWHNASLTKAMYFKLAAHDDMERQLVASNEKCEEAEATIKQLMLDIAELRQTSSRFESEVAQERVDHEQERTQDAHQKKEGCATRCVTSATSRARPWRPCAAIRRR